MPITRFGAFCHRNGEASASLGEPSPGQQLMSYVMLPGSDRVCCLRFVIVPLWLWF